MASTYLRGARWLPPLSFWPFVAPPGQPQLSRQHVHYSSSAPAVPPSRSKRSWLSILTIVSGLTAVLLLDGRLVASSFLPCRC